MDAKPADDDGKIAEVDPSNKIPITIDMLTPKQRGEYGTWLNKLQNTYFDSLTLTRQGTVIQKHKVATVPPPSDVQASGSGTSGDDKEKGKEGLEKEDANLEFKNFQGSVDYAVNHALINQSGILANVMSNVMEKMMDRKFEERRTRGPVFLPGNKFPNYRTLVTEGLPVSGIASGQPIASTSAQPNPMGATSAQPNPLGSSQLQTNLVGSTSAQPRINMFSSAHKEPEFRPRILMRSQPQYTGHNIPQVNQEHISAMFSATQPIQQPVQQPISQMPIRPQTPIQQTQPIGAQFMSDPIQQPHMVHQTPPPYTGGNMFQPYSPQGQYRPAPSPQPQFVPQFNQYELAQQQFQGAPEQQ